MLHYFRVNWRRKETKEESWNLDSCTIKREEWGKYLNGK